MSSPSPAVSQGVRTLRRMIGNTAKTVLALAFLLAAQSLKAQPRNHGIGLTLSGGGAKGLAHIGILKAIDSAGLNIDYVTGTSMGSIVGGLYAAGYHADTLERIARSIRWEDLLSNTISMRNYTMEEKSEFGKYAVELSASEKRIGLPGGFLESQELWLTLERFFFPVMGVRDFNRLSIPYACVAVDLLAAEPYTHRKGSLVEAIRSSMAIPGVFSPVDIDGRRFVDGGIIRNLPVSECREMGSKFQIGVSVSQPADSLKDIDDAVKVLGQVMFLQEARDSREQAKLCDLFVEIPMGDFNSGSFSSAAQIIDLGIREGRKLYPVFKRMADSLRAIDPSYAFRRDRLPRVEAYRVRDVQVTGLDSIGTESFLRQVVDTEGGMATRKRLENNTRDAFATRMYKSITYDMVPTDDSTFNLVYKARPETPTMVKAAINENSFTGFGVQLNLTTRNTLTPASRSMVSLQAGENFRGLAEHLQFLGYRKPWSFRLQGYAEHQEIPAFSDFRRTGAYRSRYYTVDARVQRSSKRRSGGGIGFQWEKVRSIPRFESGDYVDGSNRFFQAYGFWQFNNLARPQYAERGLKAEVKLGYVFATNPSVKFYKDGRPTGDLQGSGIPYGDYLRFEGQSKHTARLNEKWQWLTSAQAGVNFSERSSILNIFIAGGMNPTLRNQVMFAGLREGEIASESIAVLQTGPRFNPFGNLYVSLQGGVLTSGFVDKTVGQERRTLVGSSLTLAYVTPIGPAEISVMGTTETSRPRFYFNFGFPFK